MTLLKNRLKKGHQQREANYKGSEKEEEVSRALSEFSLTLRPRKIQTFFYQSSFDTSFSLKITSNNFSVKR